MSEFFFNRLLITGSRSIHNRLWFNEIMGHYHVKVLVVGTSKEKAAKALKVEKAGGKKMGIDEMACLWAVGLGIEITSLVPDWERYDKSAGVIRNSDMVSVLDPDDDRDIGVAFWDGKSRGTYDTIQKLKKAKKLHKVYTYGIKTLEDVVGKLAHPTP